MNSAEPTRDEHVCAQPCVVLPKLALGPDRAAEDARDHEADQDVQPSSAQVARTASTASR